MLATLPGTRLAVSHPGENQVVGPPRFPKPHQLQPRAHLAILCPLAEYGKKALVSVSAFWIIAGLVGLLAAGCGAQAAHRTPAVAPAAQAIQRDASGTPVPALQPGKVDLVKIAAPSLANNVFREPAQQEMAVYLPPSYAGSDRRYPVVYYLTGMGVKPASERGYPLVQAAADHLLAAGKMPEMIVVTVAGFNTLGASLYVNSPVNGNWEDFAAQDVVSYVDSHYRTLANAASRGISGHSMGGYGALNLAMKHPDVFGAVYGLSPALLDAKGIGATQMFAGPDVINTVLDRIEAIAKLPPAQAQAEFFKQYAQAGPAVQMTFAYGAAFAPAPDGKPPYIEYPYRRTAGQLTQEPEIWAEWENGWGRLDEKVRRYAANLRRLRGIGIEYGEDDENTWIPGGCAYLSSQLTAAGIPNSLLTFKGTHYSRLPQRIEGSLLPFFAEKLEFQ
jgi:S-formylglutathione hydrolase